jgi:hypothetical protein
MLLRIIQPILSIILIPLMLLSTTGVRISQHWCGDILINATIWGEAEPCSHFSSNEHAKCPMHANLNNKKNCCSQKAQIVEGGDDDFLYQSFALNVAFDFSNLLWNQLELCFAPRSILTSHFHNHSPPLLESRLFLRIQSFLI